MVHGLEFMAFIMSPEAGGIFAVLLLAIALFFYRGGLCHRVMQGAMNKFNEALQEDFAAVRANQSVCPKDMSDRFEKVNTQYAQTATRPLALPFLNLPIFKHQCMC